jgi:UDP-glucose 4-epimerase
VLVTGASGFIGAALVRGLARAGFKVRGAARNPSAVPPAEDVERVPLPDLAYAVDWRPLLQGVSHVVHLAGIAHAPGLLQEDVYTRLNAEAAGELAVAARGRVERLVFISSVRAQAGLSATHPIRESDRPAPTDDYGRSKLQGELLIVESGVPFTVLRSAVVYGRGVKGNIASLATLARTAMPLPFAGLDNRRSLLAVENLIDAVRIVLKADAAGGEIFLAADAEPITVAGLVTAMRAGLGRPPNLVRVPHGAVKRLMAAFGKEAEWERLAGEFVIDCNKLQAIGWHPRVKTPAGIAAMMREKSGNGAMAE